MTVKLGGARPPPCSGMSSVMAPNGKIYVFGGVMDVDEDEESIQGKFNNDLYTLDAASLAWRKIELKKKTSSGKEVNLAAKKEEQKAAKHVHTSADGVFTMTVGGSSATTKCEKKADKAISLNGPSPRSHAGLAFSKGLLFVYAGLYEEEERQYTLTDFYSLDVHKLEEWKTILGCDVNQLEWLGSDSESDDDDTDDVEEDSEDDEDDSEEDDSAMDTD